MKDALGCTHKVSWIKRFIAGLGVFVFAIAIQANPVLENVAHGDVTFQSAPNTLTINQTSNQAIINWNSFNIAPNETTHFQQPTGGIALNRINPTQGASQIYGQLSATGQIILMNPAGIYFGPTARVNVGGLIATTGNMTDESFLSGQYHITNVGNGVINNQGEIIARENGLIALLGNNISNEGLIQANLGKVILAAGDTFALSFNGNDLVSFAVNDAPKNVSNTGTLSANGGTVMVSAKTASNVLDNVINLSGVTEAKSVGVRNGVIILDGGDKGVVKVSGKVVASGKKTGERGGQVKITGHNILLDSTAAIDVSGDIGGGSVEIGGNYQGIGPLARANAVVMAPGAKIDASAMMAGDGGQVILWSDNYTYADGTIVTTGGLLSGNGGLIETSSKNILEVGDLNVDTSASIGMAGEWLLDPWNVTISTGAQSPGFSGGIFTPTGNSTVNTTTLQTNLASTNVTITTGTTGGPTGNITVSAPVTWSSAFNLVFTAATNIIINAAITATGGGGFTATTATGAINVNANINTSRTVAGTTGTTGTVGSTGSGNGGTGGNGGIGGVGGNGGAITLSGASVTIGSGIGIIADGGTGGTGGSAGIGGAGAAGAAGGAGTNGGNGGDGFEGGNGGVGGTGGNGGTGGTITISGTTVTLGTNAFIRSNGGIGGSGGIGGIGGLGGTGGRGGNGDITTGNGGFGGGGGDGGAGGVGGNGGFGGTINVGNASTTSLVLNSTLSSFIQTNGGLAGAGGSGGTGGNGGVGGAGGDNTLFATGGTGFSGGSGGRGGNGGNTGGGGSGGALNLVTSGITLPISGSFASAGANWPGASLGGTGGIAGASGAGGLSIFGNGSSLPQNPNNGFNGFIGGFGTIGQGNTLTITNSGAAGSTLTLNNAIYNVPNIVLNGTATNNFIIGANFAPTSGNFTTFSIGTANNVTLNRVLPANTINIASGGSGANIVTLGTNNSSVLSQALSILNVASTSIISLANGIDFSANTFNITRALVLQSASNGTVNSTIGNLTVTSGLLTLSGLFTSSSGLTVSTNALTLILSNGTTFSAPINAGALGLTLNSTGTNVLSGIISNATALNKTGAGTTTLSAANNYTGITNINAGTLSITNVNALGTTAAGTIVAAGATLDINGVAIGNEAITLNGTGAGGVGALTSTGTSSLSGNIALASAATIGGAGNFTSTGVISGTNALTKIGAGILTLSGVNTYTGATNVNAGTLSITNAAGLGTTAGTTIVAAGATLNLNNVAVGAEALTLNGTGVGSVGALTITGTSSLSGNIALASAATIGGAGNFTTSGVISGANALTKIGAGTLTLSGANTYTGATNVNAGTVSISNAAGLGTTAGATVVAAGATLDFNNVAIGAEALTLNGTGVGGVGALTSTGTSSLTGIITLASDSTIGGTGNFTTSGVISGANALTKIGAGTLTLSGANTYTGATNINAGTLSITNAAGLGTTAGTTIVAAGATLNLNNVAVGAEALTLNGTGVGGVGALTGTGTSSLTGNITLASATTTGGAGNLTLSGIISGANTLTKSGTGTLTLSNGANTYNGTTLSAGTLSIGNNSTLGIGTLSLTGGTLQSSAPITLSNAWNVGGNASIGGANNITLSGTGILSTGTLVINNSGITNLSNNLSGTGALTENSTGTLILGGNNSSYSGLLTLTAGTLSIGNNNAIGTGALIYNGGILSTSTNGLSLANNISLNTTLTYNSVNNLILSGIVSGNGGLTKLGTSTLILSGNNTYNGATTISAGTLQVGNGGTAGTLGTSIGAITNNATLIFNRSNAVNIGNNITGTGALMQNGTGITTLSGNNTYNGATNVNAGTLAIANNNALGNSSGITVLAGATLDLVGVNISTPIHLTLNGFGVNNLGALRDMDSTYAGDITLASPSSIGVGAGDTLTLTGILSGDSLEKVDLGTLVLTNNNTYTGSTAITGGTLRISSDTNLGTAPLAPITNHLMMSNGGTLETTADFELNANRGITFGQGGGIISPTADTTLTYNGHITDDFSFPLSTLTLTKSGLGTLSLGGTGDYFGGTILNSGTLLINNSDALGFVQIVYNGGLLSPGVSSVDLFNDITLNADFTYTSSNTLNLYGNINDLGNGYTIIKNGTGTLALVGNNIFGDASSPVTINNGILAVGVDSLNWTTKGITFATPVVVNTGGTLQINDNSAAFIGALTGSGNVILGANTPPTSLSVGNDNSDFTFNGNISSTGDGWFVKDGTGNFTINGSSTYTGLTYVLQGTLTLGNVNALPSTRIDINNIGNFNLNNIDKTFSVVNVTPGGFITLGAGTLTIGNNTGDTSTIVGYITGTGGLTKVGTSDLFLNNSLAANDYSGAFNIQDGSVFVSSNNGISVNSAITVNNPANLIFNAPLDAVTVKSIAGNGNIQNNMLLTINGNNTTIFSGIISDYSSAGSLIKDGTGSLTLTGANTYTGDTTLQSGTLLVGNNDALGSGTFNINGGTFGVSTDNLTIQNSIVLNANLVYDSPFSTTLSGSLFGTGGITTGLNATQLTLSDIFSSSNYSGSNVFNGGKVIASNTTSLGDSTGDTTVNAGATLVISNTNIFNEHIIINGSGVGGIGAISGEGISGISSNVTLGSDASIGATNGSTLSLFGLIDGSSNLTKTGAGTVELSYLANTLSGTTTIDAGILRISDAGALSGTSSVLVNTGGTLELNNVALSGGTLPLTLNGSGASGVGALLGSGNSSFDSPIILQSDSTIGVNSTSNLLLTGGISGTANLTKVGAGTLELSGANTYAGTTDIQNGILNATSPLPYFNLNVGAAAQFQFTQFFGTQTLPSITGTGDVFIGPFLSTIEVGGDNSSSTYNGTFSGGGILTKTGTGTFALTQASPAFTGQTFLSQGILGIASEQALGTGTVTFTGGTLQLNTDNLTITNPLGVFSSTNVGDISTITGANNATFTGIGSINDLLNVTNSGVTEFSGTLTGNNLYGLGINNATGTLILSGDTSGLTSFVNVQSGTLRLVTNSGRFGVLLADDPTAKVTMADNSVVSIGNLSGGGASGGNVLLGTNSSLTIFETSNTAYSGVISGNGSSIVKDGAGALILLGNNTYDGGTTLHNGELDVGNNNAIGTGILNIDNAGTRLGAYFTPVTLANDITIAAGADLSYVGNDNLTLNGVISGAGGVAVNSGIIGSLTLGGANTYLDGTNINNGSLLILAHSLALGNGTTLLSIADTGRLGISNSITVTNPITYIGSGALFSISGTNTFSGDLTVNGITTIGNSTGNQFALTGIISGPGSLVKNGISPVYLANANTYAGGTSVQNGAIIVGQNTSLGSGTLAFDSTFSELDAANAGLTISNALDLSVGGSAQFGGNNDFTLSGDVTLALGNNTMTLLNGRTITFSGFIHDSLGGASALNLFGGAYLFTGHNTYSGGTTLNTIFMGLGENDSLGTGNITINQSRLTGLTHALTINNSYDIITSAFFQGTHDITLSQGTTLTGDTILFVDSPITTTIQGVIDGGFVLEKRFGGTLNLANANTYTGGTILRDGTITVGNNASLGTNDVTVFLAALAATQDNINLNNAFSIIGGLDITGIHSLELSGALTNGGLLNVSNTAPTTFSGVISGAGPIQLLNTGSLTITNDNSGFTGNVTLTPSAGTLFVGNNNALGDGTGGTLFMGGGSLAATTADIILPKTYSITGTSSISGNQNIQLSGAGQIISTLNITNNATTTLSGAISQFGTINQQSTGNLVLSGTNLTFGGNIILNSGTLTIDNNDALGGSGNFIYNAGTLVNNIDGLTTPKNIVLNNTLTYNGTNSAKFTGIISGTGGLIKDGNSTLALFNNNTYAGGTTLQNGTLSVAISNGIGTGLLTLAGGQFIIPIEADPAGLTFTNNFSVTGNTAIGASPRSVTFSGTGTLNAQLTNNNLANVTFSGAISGAGSILQQSPAALILSGNNSFVGGVTLNTLAGSLAIGSNTALGTGTLTYNNGTVTTTVNNLTINNNINLNNTMTLNSAFNLALTGDISQTGGIIKQGTGALALSGNNSYQGVTSIEAGSVIANSNTALGVGGLGNTIVNAGSTLFVNDVDIATESITINGGQIIGSGFTPSLSGPITLLSDGTIVSNTVGGNFSITGNINGSHALSLNGVGTISLGGAVGDIAPLNSFTSNTAQLILNNASITSFGDQVYNSAVVLNSGFNNMILTGASSSNITFVNGVTGNNDLNIVGNAGNNAITINNNMQVRNFTADGQGGVNTLALLIPTDQQWTISSANAGSIASSAITGTGTFSNFANITSGGGNDIFNVIGSGSLSGVLNGAGGFDTLLYSAYAAAPISVIMSDPSIGAGTTYNSDALINGTIDPSFAITTFTNIDAVTGNSQGYFTVPPLKQFALVITGSTPYDSTRFIGTGFVLDPINFAQFLFFFSTPIIPLTPGIPGNVNFNFNPYVFNQNTIYDPLIFADIIDINLFDLLYPPFSIIGCI